MVAHSRTLSTDSSGGLAKELSLPKAGSRSDGSGRKKSQKTR